MDDVSYCILFGELIVLLVIDVVVDVIRVDVKASGSIIWTLSLVCLCRRGVFFFFFEVLTLIFREVIVVKLLGIFCFFYYEIKLFNLFFFLLL